MEFNERLRAERNRLGLIQADAAKLGGISFTAYQGYERGATFPNVETLQKWAIAGFDVLYLVTGCRQEMTISNEQSTLLGTFARLDTPMQKLGLTILKAMADADR